MHAFVTRESKMNLNAGSGSILDINPSGVYAVRQVASHGVMQTMLLCCSPGAATWHWSRQIHEVVI